MTLQLYSRTDDPSLTPLMGVLQRLEVAFTRFDVEADPDARQQLVKLTGALTIPTLIFDDGTYLIQPTPQQFAEKLLGSQAQPSRRLSAVLRLWGESALALTLGFSAFGVCFGVGGAYTTATFSGLSLILAAAGIGFVVLSLLPPGKRVLAAIGKALPMKALKWAIIPVMAAVMGLSLGAQHKPFDVWVWIALAVVCTVLALSAAALTREMWARWTGNLRRAQSWLGIGGLVGFLALLFLSLLLHQPSLSNLMVIPQLLLLTTMSGLGSFLLIGADEDTPGLTRA